MWPGTAERNRKVLIGKYIIGKQTARYVDKQESQKAEAADAKTAPLEKLIALHNAIYR